MKAGNKTDAVVGHSVLSQENLRHHPAAAGLEGPVVFWSGGEHAGGSAAGDHDGTRDGENSGFLKEETVRFYYCSLAEFVANGMTPALRDWDSRGRPALERDGGEYRYQTGTKYGLKLYARLTVGEKKLADLLA